MPNPKSLNIKVLFNCINQITMQQDWNKSKIITKGSFLITRCEIPKKHDNAVSPSGVGTALLLLALEVIQDIS